MKEVDTPPKKKSWWQVKGRNIKNLKAIKSIFSNHEYTFRDFDITITRYDVDAINDELGKWRSVEWRDSRLTHLIHYWVTGIVKAVKSQEGEEVSLSVVGCRDIQSLYEKVLRRPWKMEDPETELKGKVIDFIKDRATIKRDRLAQRFNISAAEVKKLLSEPVEQGEVRCVGATYYF